MHIGLMAALALSLGVSNDGPTQHTQRPIVTGSTVLGKCAIFAVQAAKTDRLRRHRVLTPVPSLPFNRSLRNQIRRRCHAGS
jgi:hypothetical protein